MRYLLCCSPICPAPRFGDLAAYKAKIAGYQVAYEKQLAEEREPLTRVSRYEIIASTQVRLSSKLTASDRQVGIAGVTVVTHTSRRFIVKSGRFQIEGKASMNGADRKSMLSGFNNLTISLEPGRAHSNHVSAAFMGSSRLCWQHNIRKARSAEVA